MSDEAFRIGPYWLSKRPDGRSDTWCITWHDPGIGTSRRKSTRTTDFEEAKSLITEHFLSSTRKTKEDPAAAIAAMIFADYLEEYAIKIPGAEQAAISIQHFMAFLEREQSAGRIIGAAKVADLTPRLMRRFIAWRRGAHSYSHENGEGGTVTFKSAGVTATTVSRNLSDIRAALNKAYKDGDLTAAPFIPDVAVGDKSPPRERVLSLTEAAALLDAASGHLFVFLMLAFCTAGRPSALLQLGPVNVDWDNDLIDLNQPGRARTKKRRPTLPIAQVLKPWLIGCPAETFVHYLWGGDRFETDGAGTKKNGPALCPLVSAALGPSDLKKRPGAV